MTANKKEHPDDPITLLRKDYEELIEKAAAWDKLYARINDFYDGPDEENEDGLLAIGEICATQMGFL